MWRCLVVVLLSILLVPSFTTAAAAAEAPNELWLYYPVNLGVTENLDKAQEIWSRAAKAGYTHILLADSKFSRLATLDRYYFKNVDRAKKMAADLKLTLVPALFNVGYSNDSLNSNPNLAEGIPVKDQLFIVHDGAALPAGDPAVKFGKIGFKDDMVAVDGGVATVQPGGKKNAPARMTFQLKVQPFHCYHVSVDIKADGYKGDPEIKALAGDWTLQWQKIHVKPTQDWKSYDVVFNSLKSSEVNVYFGDWSYRGQGTLQWRNWKIEEAGLVNILRRDGCLLTVKGDDAKTYEEGKDFDRVVDPKMGVVPYAGEYVAWHEPAAMKVKGIPEGTKLHISWYHPAIVYDGQVAACIADPGYQAVLTDQAKRMKELFAAPGYMMSHDEFRVFGWDESCLKTGKTPGQMLADNLRFCTDLLKPARAYVWNDMFDPYHNAVPGPYYLVNGSWEGSWEGLRKDVVIVNWNFDKRDKSLKFFADRGNPQLIAGYYDGSHDTTEWMASAAKVTGVIGYMYTSWQNDYSQLEKFAKEVNGK